MKAGRAGLLVLPLSVLYKEFYPCQCSALKSPLQMPAR